MDNDCLTCQKREIAKLRQALLVQVSNLLERAGCALIPDMEDTPTARDEIQRAQFLLYELLED